MNLGRSDFSLSSNDFSKNKVDINLNQHKKVIAEDEVKPEVTTLSRPVHKKSDSVNGYVSKYQLKWFDRCNISQDSGLLKSKQHWGRKTSGTLTGPVHLRKMSNYYGRNINRDDLTKKSINFDGS